MTAELARLGGPVAAAGLALLVLAADRRLRLAGLAAWALGGAALLAYLAPAGHTGLLVAAGTAGLLVAAALAIGIRRWPWLVPLGALACMPIRIPVDVGDTEANLLVPLYGLIAAAALVIGWELLHDDVRARELGPLGWPLAGLVAWSAFSLAWTDDLREGAIELAAFLLPFGLLALALTRLEWTRSTVVALGVLLAGMAVAFAAVGVYQWVTRDVFWNPKVIIANAYHPELFFRVNSVFWDPSIYGRFLVVAILATLVVVLTGVRRDLLIGAAAASAAMWAGLLFSFSQSSFVALVFGVLVAAAYAWRWRALAALGLTAVLALSLGFGAPSVRKELLDRSWNRATSGRSKLVSEGLRIARDHPIAGVGVGGFKRAYAERTGLRGREPKAAASHNTPVTVAAETGLPGLALLGWLGVAALLAAFRGADASVAGRARLVVGVVLAAIGVHSLFYNAFFEDPMTWVLFALAVAPLAVGARMRA
ncbi:MAG: O-antigen ligase family protein [Gaiellaceae bacterium]